MDGWWKVIEKMFKGENKRDREKRKVVESCYFNVYRNHPSSTSIDLGIQQTTSWVWKSISFWLSEKPHSISTHAHTSSQTNYCSLCECARNSNCENQINSLETLFSQVNLPVCISTNNVCPINEDIFIFKSHRGKSLSPHETMRACEVRRSVANAHSSSFDRNSEQVIGNVARDVNIEIVFSSFRSYLVDTTEIFSQKWRKATSKYCSDCRRSIRNVFKRAL